MTTNRRALAIREYVDGVRAGDRGVLGRAITLVESQTASDRALAQKLLVELLPHTGTAHRVGISGVPGAGKSTFIETLGTNLTSRGHHVAVLAVDPSSGVTGGSILGDKTRMPKLARDERAFVRPSPSGGSLGGVTRKTRETILVCEAAGFDVILVETVGVGQSETAVHDMVDFFLVLTLAGAGDELQGIKRGIVELADLVAINKADGDNEKAAQRARREYASALALMRVGHAGWKVPVVTCSGLRNTGLDALWTKVLEHRNLSTETGEFARRREAQLRRAIWTTVDDRLAEALRAHPEVKRLATTLEADVVAGKIPPTLAAARLLDAFGAGHD